MAWDRVTPTTIANCFAKCGFFRSSEEVPSEQEEPIEGWELLDAGCTAEDFCTADDNLATCGARTVEDIVEEATCEVADSSDDGDNIDEGDGEGPPPAAETLHALDVLRRAVAADEISDDTRVLMWKQSGTAHQRVDHTNSKVGGRGGGSLQARALNPKTHFRSRWMLSSAVPSPAREPQPRQPGASAKATPVEWSPGPREGLRRLGGSLQSPVRFTPVVLTVQERTTSYVEPGQIDTFREDRT
ncbi:hypothetical protein HPB52_003827 [Rhipicephalus sanguineus]|uniref:Uncharacterized protein n=1 Tax=Rhipicephalus sanguineus TaxID=34632 RepID=A0A9D4T6T1_RHISA|nr:hypothetical protein HPB52_003827 [Rhipicephalus sanguineus]